MFSIFSVLLLFLYFRLFRLTPRFVYFFLSAFTKAATRVEQHINEDVVLFLRTKAAEVNYRGVFYDVRQMARLAVGTLFSFMFRSLVPCSHFEQSFTCDYPTLPRRSQLN